MSGQRDKEVVSEFQPVLSPVEERGIIGHEWQTREPARRAGLHEALLCNIGRHSVVEIALLVSDLCFVHERGISAGVSSTFASKFDRGAAPKGAEG
jgi:hypothetical protein